MRCVTFLRYPSTVTATVAGWVTWCKARVPAEITNPSDSSG